LNATDRCANPLVDAGRDEQYGADSRHGECKVEHPALHEAQVGELGSKRKDEEKRKQDLYAGECGPEALHERTKRVVDRLAVHVLIIRLGGRCR
jgi:hypothetical protein